jgi:outer membrane immunogenic protein
MRRFLLAAVVFGAASGARAADLPDLFPALRGSEGLSTATRNWDGWYAGGQVGYQSSSVDFSQSVVGLTNFIFRNSVLQQPTSQWSLLNKANMQGTGFGAFVGRNWQWDDLVFGVEANYNYMNRLATNSASSISLAIPNSASAPPNHTYTYNTTLTGAASLQIKDVMTFRGRAGWAAGNFMPYIFGGLAVGRMDVFRSVTSNVVLQDDQTTTTTDAFGNVTTVALPPVYSNVPSLSTSTSQERTNNFVVGWTGGIGTEYMVWNGLFLRGEWEYIKFLSVMNTSVTMNSLHLGLGYKF